jgi:hypothetical protein
MWPTAVTTGHQARPVTVTGNCDLPCDVSHSVIAQPAELRPAGDLVGRRIGSVSSPNPNRASSRLKRERSTRSSADGRVTWSPFELSDAGGVAIFSTGC